MNLLLKILSNELITEWFMSDTKEEKADPLTLYGLPERISSVGTNLDCKIRRDHRKMPIYERCSYSRKTMVVYLRL